MFCCKCVKHFWVLITYDCLVSYILQTRFSRWQNVNSQETNQILYTNKQFPLIPQFMNFLGNKLCKFPFCPTIASSTKFLKLQPYLHFFFHSIDGRPIETDRSSVVSQRRCAYELLWIFFQEVVLIPFDISSHNIFFHDLRPSMLRPSSGHQVYRGRRKPPSKPFIEKPRKSPVAKSNVFYPN